MVSTFDSERTLVRTRDRAKSDDEQTFIASFESRLHWMAIAWRDEILEGLVFGYLSCRSAEITLARQPRLPRPFCCMPGGGQVETLPAWMRELVDSLRRFADGEPVDFAGIKLNQDHLTTFGRRVVASCRRIGWGQTRSYGDLAAECGSPGAARAVGSVMAKNRFPLIVPCHRVLAAGGELGGYSAPDGLKMKRRLLAMEGALSF